jgi:hypothetical protein
MLSFSCWHMCNRYNEKLLWNQESTISNHYSCVLQANNSNSVANASSSSGAVTIAELLARNHAHCPPWLLVVCTARRQSRSVTRQFAGFRKIVLDDLRKAHVVRDVQQYILCRLDRDDRLRLHLSRETAELLNQLHIKCNGCFLYLEKVTMCPSVCLCERNFKRLILFYNRGISWAEGWRSSVVTHVFCALSSYTTGMQLPLGPFLACHCKNRMEDKCCTIISICPSILAMLDSVMVTIMSRANFKDFLYSS